MSKKLNMPSIEEAQIAAVSISEMITPKLTAQDQAFFIAGFAECIKWLVANQLEQTQH